MKRVLMIIPFFPPMGGGGVYRPLSFVKYLERYGWRPTVVAPRGDAYWIRDDKLAAEIPDTCRVVRTETMSGQSLLARVRRGTGPRPQRRSSRLYEAARRLGAAFLLPDTYRGWRPFALRSARRLLGEETYHAIYSTSPPETSHLAAGTIHAETALPWVADFRDPWMNLYLLAPPTRVHARLHRRMEARVCNRAHVVVTTRAHEAMMRERFPEAPSITRIPNGYDAAAAGRVLSIAPAPAPMRITHAGMLTQDRSAIPFLRGLRRFLDLRPEAEGDVEVRFLGPRENANDVAVEEMGLARVVSFSDTVSHGETLQIERASHILLLIKHVNRYYEGLVPGKLYEYVGVGRPILALVPHGEAREIVETLRRGVAVDQEDVDAVANGIERLYDAYRAGTLDDPFDLAPRPELTRERLAGELAALLDRIATGGGRAS